jgi:hypothetical protein
MSSSTKARWIGFIFTILIFSIALVSTRFTVGEQIDYVARYAKSVEKLLKEEGIFILVSINHEKEELVKIFSQFEVIIDASDVLPEIRILVFKKSQIRKI